MTRKQASKLVLLPVPAGHKMKYNHIYVGTKDEVLFKDEGKWYVATDPETPAVEYTGTRKLAGTDAWLEDESGLIVASGMSTCNPKDTPNKKLGRAIAHNRCVKNYKQMTTSTSPQFTGDTVHTINSILVSDIGNA